MCVEINEHTKKQQMKITKMSKHIKNLQNEFDNIKIDILSKFDKNNHVIDFKKDEKSSFMSLYNLSQNELTKFRRYIENVLIKH